MSNPFFAVPDKYYANIWQILNSEKEGVGFLRFILNLRKSFSSKLIGVWITT